LQAEADRSYLADVTTTAATDSPLRKADIGDPGLDRPGFGITEVKGSRLTDTDTVAAKATFSGSEVDFRISAVPLEQDVVFTGTDTPVATGAEIQKAVDTCPGGPEDINR
jgi:hypothetical protein